jgi:hypothetical protein
MTAWVAAAAPFILIAAMIGAIYLLLEDFWGYLHGKESVFGDVVAAWQAPFNAFMDNLEARFDRAQAIIATISRMALLISGNQYVLDKFGYGGSSPQASAQMSSSVAEGLGKPAATTSFKSNVTINAAPGMKPEEVAGAVIDSQEDFYKRYMGSAYEAVR